jgi:hypothetical protein
VTTTSGTSAGPTAVTFSRWVSPALFACRIREVVCRQCREDSFSVLVDDEEGCALTICLNCRTEAPIADSGEQLEDADLAECASPCGGERFGVAIGFAMTADDEVRWISVGLRCLTDGTVGVYSDWKIDYTPTAHLLASA